MTQVRAHGTRPVNAGRAKRAVHTLSDGSALTVLVDRNESTQQLGDKDNVQKLYLHWSGDRVTWTQKFGASMTFQNITAIYSSALDVNNNLHFVYRTTNGTILYILFTYAAGGGNPTWTGGTPETVFAETVIANSTALDIDVANVSSSVQVPIVSLFHTVGNTPRVHVYTRKTAATVGWVQSWAAVSVTAQSNVQGSEDCAIAVEATPASATAVRAAIMLTKVGSGSGDLGDTLEFIEIDTTTGSAFSNVNWGNITNLNVGQGGGKRNVFLFAGPSNTFVWVEVVGGTSNGFISVGKVDRSGAVIIPKSDSAKSLPFSRAGSGYNESAVTYQDGVVNVVYNPQSGMAHTVIAAFQTNNTVLYGGAFYWDNAYKYGSYPNTSQYGGGNKNNDSGFRRHDIVTSYGIRPIDGTASSRQYMHAWVKTLRAPAAIRPANGSTVNTDQPAVGLDADIDQQYANSTYLGRWEFARDAGFTNSLRVYKTSNYYTVQGTNVAGAVVAINDRLPAGQELFGGTWYVRGALEDLFGKVHTYFATATITVSHPPTAKDLAPTGGVVTRWGTGVITFAWGFVDTSPSDAQTAYQVIVERNDTGAAVFDTGKVVSSAQFANVTLPGTAKDIELRWKLVLWDSDDTQGPASAYQVFTAADAPVVTITSPVAAAVVTTARPTFNWTFAVGGGRVQTAYRVEVKQGADIVHDSGWRNGSVTSYTPTGTILANMLQYSVTVYVRDSVGLEGTNTVAFSTQWVLPAVPSGVTIDATRYDTDGFGDLRVAWSDTGRDAEFYSWRVYRRVLMNGVGYFDQSAWTLAVEIFAVNPGGYQVSDYLAPGGGHQVDYYVTQTALRFDSLVESVSEAQLNSGNYTPMASVFPSSPNYWLIDATGNENDPGLNMKLFGVAGDTFTDEYEEGEYQVIGAGRRVAKGDRLGVQGNLDIRVRMDGQTNLLYPRSKRLKLEDLKERQTPVYLRTPFGDVYKVELRNFSWTRVAGVGTVEFMDLQIPYTEVSG